MGVYLIYAIFKGAPAGNNPWGALTLEWTTSSPPAHHNFEPDPKLEYDAYDYDKVIAHNGDNNGTPVRVTYKDEVKT